MSFKIGDRVKLTGPCWPKSATSLPARGTTVVIAGIASRDEYVSNGEVLYEIEGRAGRLWMSEVQTDSFGAELLAEATPPTPATPRAEALAKAADLIGGDRQDDYGSPAESFARIAKLWSALLGTEINASQVAIMLAAMKLSRLTGKNYDHADSWIDLAGYAGLGYEISKGE